MSFRPYAGFVLLLAALTAHAAPAEPDAHVFKTTPQGELRLYVFAPEARKDAAPRAAIVVVHGGGWHVGEAAWTFDGAKRYADLGLVAASVDYRLSNEKDVTPVDALEDVRDAVRWLRSHANELGIDPQRIAAHGSSAGSHLSAAAALTEAPTAEHSGAPNLLVLNSLPADVTTSGWFRRLLGERDAAAHSPLQLVGAQHPAAFVFGGSEDTVTPIAPVRAFCDALRRSGADCVLQVYEGVGHLLTRKLDPRAQEEGPFDADPETIADVRRRIDAFLARHGYIEPAKPAAAP